MPIGNPRVPLGSLNRLRASITWPNFPSLNVTASYLGNRGINIRWEGNTTAMLPVLTGVVTSPEPFMLASFSIHLNKAQPLAPLYQSQILTQAQIGDCTIRPDVPAEAGGLQLFDFVNCAIQSIDPIDFAGRDPDFVVMCQGSWLINSSLWL